MWQKAWQGESFQSKIRDYALISLGAFLQALALRLFLVPASLASGGISGISQIVNHFTGFPIGLMTFLGNIPLFVIGWRYLGGRRFALRTAFAVTGFSFLTDFLVRYLPAAGITHDMTLNALYGGVISGIGFGFVYQGRATSGGSDILARILNRWRGISISQSYLITDALVMFLAGLAFNWERALYALVMLYISGIAAEVITQGVNVARTAMIITNKPDEVKEQILYDLVRGVTLLNARGGYTGEERTVLYCVISRTEVGRLKDLVHSVDPQAFMVIGDAYEALGEGFKTLGEK